MINSNIFTFLGQKGYKISQKAFEVIDTCFNWHPIRTPSPKPCSRERHGMW